MATIIPGLNSTATSGERRFAHRLESLLEDDYLCWFNVPFGRRNRHPDFVLLHPRRGLLVVEVKDWKLDIIRSISRTSVTLLTPTGLKEVRHPIGQARQYALVLKEILECDPTLLAPAGHPHAGRLVFPYGYGVVLSEVTRKQFDSTDLGEVMQPHLVICKDEMVNGVDAEAFQKRLWDMFTVRFDTVLTQPQVDRIRWHLFPEIRISQAGSFPPEKHSEQNLPSGDSLIPVMDLQQEQLARSLGEGHRVIHGVAGSGKTLILGYRCERLAQTQTLNKPILVLCFNVPLAAKLEHMIDERGLADRVTVRHFHRWCFDQLKLYHVVKPVDGDGFPDRLVSTVINAVEREQIPRAQYGAVMIDEGHDFEPAWLKLITQMVDPATNSLLLLYDDAQAIYGNKRSPRFSFKSVGIQAQGRTTILQVNYRNTNEILDCAYEFAKDVIKPEEAEDDGIPLVKPEMAGRHGPPPKLIRASSLKDEARTIAKELNALHVEGAAWKEMAVLYPKGFVGEKVVAALQKAKIPCEWLHRDSASRNYNPTEDSVKVITMHSSKGLEFPIIVIAGLGFMPYSKEKEADDARLLYVAMTRATKRLVMAASKQGAFVGRLMLWEKAA